MKRAPRRKAAPSDALLEQAALQFRALSEPSRLKILQRLMEGPANVSELGQVLLSSQANASKHVAILASVGFVVRRRVGPSVLCELGDDVVRELCQLMCERALARAEEGLRTVRNP